MNTNFEVETFGRTNNFGVCGSAKLWMLASTRFADSIGEG